jgi:hypothetical protein
MGSRIWHLDSTRVPPHIRQLGRLHCGTYGRGQSSEMLLSRTQIRIRSNIRLCYGCVYLYSTSTADMALEYAHISEDFRERHLRARRLVGLSCPEDSTARLTFANVLGVSASKIVFIFEAANQAKKSYDVTCKQSLSA